MLQGRFSNPNFLEFNYWKKNMCSISFFFQLTEDEFSTFEVVDFIISSANREK